MKREPGPDELIFLGKRRAAATPSYINWLFRRTAMKLASQGLIQNGDEASWHSHALRHSFKTQGEHARVQSMIVEFWMGHNQGIGWVYDNRDQVYAEDFVKEYRKLEPYLSLDANENALKEEYEEKEKRLYDRVIRLEEQLAALLAQRESSSAPGPLRASGRGQTSEP